MLPTNNPTQNAFAHNNAGSPAVYIASGSCTEQNTKVKRYIDFNSLLLFFSLRFGALRSYLCETAKSANILLF